MATMRRRRANKHFLQRHGTGNWTKSEQLVRAVRLKGRFALYLSREKPRNDFKTIATGRFVDLRHASLHRLIKNSSRALASPVRHCHIQITRGNATFALRNREEAIASHRFRLWDRETVSFSPRQI